MEERGQREDGRDGDDPGRKIVDPLLADHPTLARRQYLRPALFYDPRRASNLARRFWTNPSEAEAYWEPPMPSADPVELVNEIAAEMNSLSLTRQSFFVNENAVNHSLFNDGGTILPPEPPFPLPGDDLDNEGAFTN